jgi:hypothetical protein
MLYCPELDGFLDAFFPLPGCHRRLDRSTASSYTEAVAPEDPPMDRRSFLAGCASLALTELAHAGDNEKPPSPDIERLIKQLGGRKFREREAASKALDKLGEAALDALRRAAKHDADAEVRYRAGRLVERMEQRLTPVFVKRILDSQLSRAEKARRLRPFIKRGMSRANVISLLGKPDAHIISGGCGLAREPPRYVDGHVGFWLVVTYDEHEAVVRVELFRGI